MIDKERLIALLKQGGLVIRTKASNGYDTAQCYYICDHIQFPIDYDEVIEPLYDAGTLDMEYPNAWDGGLMFYKLAMRGEQ